MIKPLEETLCLYHIYPLGLTNALHDHSPQNRFDILYQWLDHIHGIGCDMIQIGPMACSLSHGYDTVDYYTLDPRLGHNDDFRQWIDKAHAYGIRVIVDTVFNHVSRRFFAFEDLLENQENSSYKDWFKDVNFGSTNAHHDPFSYKGWHGIEDLVELNLTNPKVKDYLFDVTRTWIESYGIDGMRLDSADVMDFQFLKELKVHANTIKPGFIMLGEVIHGDYGHIIRHTDLDTLTNYALHKAIYSSANSKNYFELAHNQDRLYGPYGLCQNIPLVTFVDNHDVTRIIDNLSNPEDIFNVYTYIFTAYGIPSIYYGSEFGLHGIKMPGNDDSLRPALDLKEWLNQDIPLYDHIQKLIAIRHQYIHIFSQPQHTVVLTNTVYGYIRGDNKERIMVLLSISDKNEFIDITLHDLHHATCLLNTVSYEIHPNRISMVILPHQSIVMKIE